MDNAVTTRFLWRETSDIWADVISALSFLRLAVVVVARLLCTVLSLCTLAVSPHQTPSLPPSLYLSHIHVESNRVRIYSKQFIIGLSLPIFHDGTKL